MKEVFVPYNFRTRKGAKITKERYSEGRELWVSTKEFCESHIKNSFKVDSTVYGKGIRVELEDSNDVKAIQEWINNQ